MKLTRELIDELRKSGLTQRQIAEMFGVSPQYVSKLKRQDDDYWKTKREISRETYPWEHPDEFNHSVFALRLRDHAEYMASGGEGMADWKLERLQSFYETLIEQDVVVEFDPAIPPDTDTVGGFAYRPRRPSDRDLIIRVNRHTNLPEENEIYWRMPPRLPLS